MVRLIAPESRQLFAAGAELNVLKHTAIQTEVALSNRDLNRFSPLGNTDNTGMAVFANIRQQLLPAAMKKGWELLAAAQYEFAGKQFLSLNPYRPAEFARDWNVGTVPTTATEHWARGSLSLQKTGWGTLRYEYGAFLRDSLYDGARHLAQARLQRAGFDVLAEINMLQTNGLTENTRFSRPKFDVAKTFFFKNKKPLFKLGVYGERERNERRPTQADTLGMTSFWYDLSRVYLQTPENQGVWQVGASWMHRNDFVPTQNIFSQNTAADEMNLTGRWTPAPSLKPGGGTQTLSWNLSWRQLRILDADLTPLEPQQTYLGRVDYTLSAWKSALALTTGYELGSGQSPRIEFNYVRVNPGEGQYTWEDRNRDSILQVDEMEIAVFQDQANYVRVAVTTTDYLRTNNVAFTRRVLAAARGEPAWNPFDLSVSDTALVAVSSVLRNVLYLNRADPIWDASLAYGDSRSRTALTTGFESRRLSDWTLHGRINFSRLWSLEIDLTRGEKSNDSQTFNNRDYTVPYWRTGPKLSWLPARSFRVIASYLWQDSRNLLPSGENARQTDWSAELTWNPNSPANDAGFRAVTSLRAKATFARVNYNGMPNTAVAYAMLEGLQDGRNYLWSLNLDRQLSRSVQLSLQYEGRKTGDTRVIHVGRAQVRAVF